MGKPAGSCKSKASRQISTAARLEERVKDYEIGWETLKLKITRPQ